MKFTKMQGAGNDYIYVNCFEEKVSDPESTAVKVSDRHFGIGSDGLVLIEPSDKADFKMDIYNADGSRAKMCGNATRCVAKYVCDRGLTNKDEISLETLSGIKYIKVFKGDDGKVKSARVDMGAPVLSGKKSPRCLTATRLWVRRCTSAANWAIKSLRAFQWATRIALPMWTT